MLHILLGRDTSPGSLPNWSALPCPAPHSSHSWYTKAARDREEQHPDEKIKQKRSLMEQGAVYSLLYISDTGDICCAVIWLMVVEVSS